MPEISLPNSWNPRPYQRPLWDYLEAGGKRAIEIAHRRFGKDDVALHFTATAAHQRVGTYWHMLPEAAQARKAVWDAVNPHTGQRRIDEAFPEALRESKRDNDMFIRFRHGSTWQVVGSDNFNSLMGSPPVGIVFSEWALANPSAWAYLQPVLEENGGWALFITTPRGRNHAATFYEAMKDAPGWFAEILTAKDTDVFSDEQLERIRLEYIALNPEEGELLFNQEYMCSLNAAIVGSYYGKSFDKIEAEGRLGTVPYDTSVPVHTCWDLGIGDSTAIWFFQQCGREVHWIDYMEASGVELAWYAKQLQDRPYVYGRHLLPHDAEAKELGTGKSRQEVLQGLGVKSEIVPKLSVDDGIQAARDLLARSWFDIEKCKRGVDAMRQYRRQWDDKLRMFKQRPLHDWASHGADAFRYGAVGMKEEAPPAPPPVVHRRAGGSLGWMAP